ncbi:hypothetical protein C5167_031556 [Papaver somniferum]|uniref:Uncharacterized protein n=1 Tax=Papaver somniferum TaxID=3469 RepID=A0A4Y7K8G5_PAPSO|nr:hypothetical protein C5167_031556 [Papaver somniferum]
MIVTSYCSYVIPKQWNLSRIHQVKLAWIVKALKCLESGYNVVECIMEIRIYKNLMEGYLPRERNGCHSKQVQFSKPNEKTVSS